MTPGEVADRLAIADVADGYVHALDAKDWAAIPPLFTADAVIDYTSFGGPTGPPSGVIGWVDESLSAFDVCQHFVTNRRVVVTGDTATADAYFFNPLGTDGKPSLMAGGYYRDRFTRTPGGWLMSSKTVERSWMHTA